MSWDFVISQEMFCLHLFWEAGRHIYFIFSIGVSSSFFHICFFGCLSCLFPGPRSCWLWEARWICCCLPRTWCRILLLGDNQSQSWSGEEKNRSIPWSGRTWKRWKIERKLRGIKYTLEWTLLAGGISWIVSAFPNLASSCYYWTTVLVALGTNGNCSFHILRGTKVENVSSLGSEGQKIEVVAWHFKGMSWPDEERVWRL